MDRGYTKSPIIEALCQLQFEADPNWDIAIPGLLYERLQDTFPKRRQANLLTVGIAAGPGSVQPQLETAIRIQFLREDEKALVQVGPNFLAVNRLRPYESWAEFFPLIRRAVEAYREVASPPGVQRVELHYINGIEIESPPDGIISLARYFEFYPHVGPRLPQQHGPFIAQIHLGYADGRDDLRLHLQSGESGKLDTQMFLLDLHYSLLESNRVGFDELSDWIQLAHDNVEAVFEASITDALRETFKEASG
jgi:uncharacterized protein (TIGR04255 family)